MAACSGDSCKSRYENVTAIPAFPGAANNKDEENKEMVWNCHRYMSETGHLDRLCGGNIYRVQSCLGSNARVSGILESHAVKGKITVITMLIDFSFPLSFSSGAVSSHVLVQLCHIRRNEAAPNSKTPEFQDGTIWILASSRRLLRSSMFFFWHAQLRIISPNQVIRSERVCTWTPFDIRMKFRLYGAFSFWSGFYFQLFASL